MARKRRPPLPPDNHPWPHPWMGPILRLLRRCPNISHACLLVGIHRNSFYSAKETHPDFATAVAAAIDEGVEAMEQECWRRAMKGVKKPVYQGGKLVGHLQEYSDVLLIFMLKAHRPEKYRDKQPDQPNKDLPPISTIEVERPAPGASDGRPGDR